jgi:hypothetical protein
MLMGPEVIHLQLFAALLIGAPDLRAREALFVATGDYGECH